MKQKLLILMVVVSLFNFSCKQRDKPKIIAKKGNIKILTNVYHNASKSLKERNTYYVSKMNFEDNILLEIIPNLKNPEFISKVFLIKDTVVFPVNVEDVLEKNLIFKEIISKGDKRSVFTKLEGAKFNRDIYPENYENRKELTDTILFGKKYKRIQIKTDTKLSQFYIHPTDTIIPYSFNKLIERDYEGRIERIDFYDKENDLFITIILIPNYNIDKDMKEIFELNQYVENLKEK